MTAPTATIAFLACATTLPDAPDRRADAAEHDRMVAALAPALAAEGVALRVIDWEAELAAFEGIALAMIGTTWNYWDKPAAFLARLEALEARGIAVANPAELVRWNSRKTYLRELEEAGITTIPTLWQGDVTRAQLEEAFYHFGCDRLVVKRQIGAGAEGQELFARGELPGPDWCYGHAAMLQPFLATIQDAGEVSLIFIDGAFSHALRKTAAPGEYRIQSLYGGSEQDYAPSEDEIAAAQNVLDALPFDPPLYARIDMVRSERGELLLMEAEMVEPYLYPEQGPQLGERLARAIAARVQRL